MTGGAGRCTRDVISTYWARWPLIFRVFIILVVHFLRGGIIQGVAIAFNAARGATSRRQPRS